MKIFQNRTEAGRELATRLAGMKPDDPVVLALPRGGVPVAIEVARAFSAPLDLVMVRKIGAPGQPELAIGAVVNGDDPKTVLNDRIVRAFGLDADRIDDMVAAQLDEIARRRALYLRGRPQVPVAGRTVIVVDDGIATGATVRASLAALRRRGPRRLILAVPVAPADTLEALKPEVDATVCLSVPDRFRAVGAHFRDFGQTSDAEVVALLDEAAQWTPARD